MVAAREMVGVVKSANPCPNCGGHSWYLYSALDEFAIPLVGPVDSPFTATVDMLPDDLWVYPDECIDCGIVVT